MFEGLREEIAEINSALTRRQVRDLIVKNVADGKRKTSIQLNSELSEQDISELKNEGISCKENLDKISIYYEYELRW
ncbi:hypothetical protein [Companilactobacillus metriopterae]|uniref:hypothetical protein n=1 Tax=Companilactobacillus metriopterae TaxID=1909267 RepID=UPI00100B91F5|nr:hypothetical protein [Companilactobacillus metriopterae]